MYKLGYHHTEEEKDKIRQSKLGVKNPNYGKKLSPETCAKMSASRMGIKRPKNIDMIEKQRASLKEYYQTEQGKEFKKRLSDVNKGTSYHLGFRHEFSEEFKVKRSKFMKDVWARGEDYKNQRVYNILKASNIRPNKPETALLNTVNDIQPNEWKYVGDGSFIICGRNPDIVNINGKKSVMLLHGVYWHLWRKQETNPEITREDIEREDKQFYKTYGWDCLIVWEDDLIKCPEYVKELIRDFINS